jgi:hypothetical protein
MNARARVGSLPHGEPLHTVHERVFAQVELTMRVLCHAARQDELAGVGALHAPLPHEFAVGREVVHPHVVRLDDDDVSLVVEAHALGFAQVDLRQLPLEQETPVGTELLDAARDVGDVEVVVAVAGEGARLVELARRDPARTDDLHRREQLRIERGGDVGCGVRRAAEQQGQNDE